VTRPRRPRDSGLEPDPVRSYRMPEETYRAIENKARESDPPRTVSDLTRALLEAWLDDELDVQFLGDIVVPRETA
jgi:hypothetical protein